MRTLAWLGIDYGTSNTVAMLSWNGERTRPLLFDGSPLLPSGVCLDGDGELLTGRDALRAARIVPQAYEPNPKRRIDDGDVLLGGHAFPASRLIAATLARVWREAVRVTGEPAQRVVVTCPVQWGQSRQAILLDAAEQAGIPAVTLVPEPVAAATYFADVLGHRLRVGSSLVVYDLGAGTLDVSVVQRTPTGLIPLAYRGTDRLGGLDLDEAVVSIVGDAVGPGAPDDWRRLRNPTSTADYRHVRTLWRDAAEVKEALSGQSSAAMLVPLVDRDVVVTREQFETAARPLLARTVDVALQCLRQARTEAAHTAGVFLVGGATRTPLVATLLHAATGVAPTVLDQPELVVAEGALRAASADTGADPGTVAATDTGAEPGTVTASVTGAESGTAAEPATAAEPGVSTAPVVGLSRQSSPPPPLPPRRSRRSTTAAASVTVLVLIAALVGYCGSADGAGTAGCSGNSLTLSVAASPEIAAAVRSTAADWAAKDGRADGRCVAVDVTAVEPADVAAVVAERSGATVAGVARGRRIPVPDVWIPDSSLWLQRLGTPTAPSIASSPLVVAVPGPAAATGAPATWSDLVRRMTTGTGLRAGIVEPTRDSAGLAGLIALAAAAQQVGEGDAAQVTGAILRSLVAGRSALREDLYRRFPAGTDAAALAGGIAAAPLSEQSVAAYNATSPPAPLVPVYAEPSAFGLDFPYVVLPGVDRAKRALAERLRGALAGPVFTDRLAGAGLRAADGSVGRDFLASLGRSSGRRDAAAPPRATVDRILTTWTAMTSPARLLTVIDVSGSMLRPVPTAGNATRMQVTLNAARRGLALFDDSWSCGLWIFSTELDGATDHRELVPIESVGANRQSMVDALASVTPKRTGNTGLHDSILAGYSALRNGWTAGMVNTLIVLTDGENDDPHGLSREQLLAELGRVKDPGRPIRVLLIAIGPDVAPDNLRPITDVTGGGVFAAPDPARIGEIFFEVITSRT